MQTGKDLSLQDSGLSDLPSPNIKGEVDDAPGETTSTAPAEFRGGGPESEEEKPFRRKRRVKGQKICGVCGDLAQSHNFGALTCETCKAFFRRNANKQKELQSGCSFNGTCNITKATRRFCASCRLNKCYVIGMDPELILDDEERKERQRKRDQAAARRQAGKTDLAPSTSSSPSTSSPPSTSTRPRPTPACLSGDTSGGDADTSCPGDSAVPASDSSHRQGETRGAEPSQSTSQEAQAGLSSTHRSAAQRLQFPHVSTDLLPSNSDLYWPLSSTEKFLLDHLTSCYKEIFWSGAVTQNSAQVKLQNIPLDKVMVAFDLLLRKFITFSKRVPEFRNLQEADQIALLKATAMRLYCVRLAEAYVPEHRSWLTPMGEVTEQEVAHLFKDPSILTAIIDFCRGVKYVVGKDITVFALIQTLVIFDTSALQLGHREEVNGLRDKYTVLLKHHLQALVSFKHADRYLTEVFGILVDVEALGKNLLDFFSDYSSHFVPLISEFINQ